MSHLNSCLILGFAFFTSFKGSTVSQRTDQVVPPAVDSQLRINIIIIVLFVPVFKALKHNHRLSLSVKDLATLPGLLLDQVAFSSVRIWKELSFFLSRLVCCCFSYRRKARSNIPHMSSGSLRELTEQSIQALYQWFSLNLWVITDCV